MGVTDTFTPRGWICPVCGAGCAPTLDRCCPGWTVTPAPRPLTAADVQRYAPIPLSPGSTLSGESLPLFQPAPSTAPLPDGATP